jgi:hypothetical protein
VPTQLPQEVNGVLAVGDGIDGQEPEVQPEVAPFRADRDGIDGGDPVVAVPGLEDGRPASVGPGCGGPSR